MSDQPNQAVLDRLAGLEAAMRDDMAAREENWRTERAETAARHRSEVARIQANAEKTSSLHERSVVASERLAAAMERIALSLTEPSQ